MKIYRKWAMPNKNTFDIQPIKEFIYKHLVDGLVIDPFANKNTIATITNDLDPQYNTTYNLEALDFLKTFKDSSVSMVLFDPPYTPRQVKECYTKLERTVTISDTSQKYWSTLKKEISRIVIPGGKVISFAWNSNGIGKCNGFDIEEILIIAHGGSKNDTIVTLEIKRNALF